MTKFHETDAGAAFIATASSRETSPEVMKAFAFLARTEAEAVALWEGDGFGTVCQFSDVVEIATGNGRIDTADLYWGGMDLAQFINDGDFA